MGVVTLAEAKVHLRVDGSDEDALITAHLQAAERHIETTYGIVSTQRSAVFASDRFAAWLTIPRRPVTAGGVTVAYLDGAGAAQTVASPRVMESDGWTRVAPAGTTAWPRVLDAPGAVTITATIGFASGADPATDPCLAAVRAATLLIVGDLYTNREAGGRAWEVVDMLLDGFRLKRV